MALPRSVTVLATAVLTTMAAGAVACGSVSGSPVASPAAASSPAASPPSPAPAPAGGSAAIPAACAAFLAPMTLRQKLAQLIMVGVTGTADAVAVTRAENPGGIFVGSFTDLSMLTSGGVAQVQAVAKIPVAVSIDEEGGRVSRLRTLVPSDPSARETAATMNVEETYAMALARGQQLKKFGITVDFAPDVDVSSQPDDAVIGDRSYSNDPATVVAYAGAFARGLRDAGVYPVIKHFPGHGSSSGDSHTGAVSVPPIAQLQTKDLVPFRDLVGTGVGVMVGHLDVPNLTTPGLPASLSSQVMSLLRDGVGYGAAPFDGPIYTDDLSGMAAITDRLGIDEAVSTALGAGADVALWLSTDDVPAVLDHLEQSVASGVLDRGRIDASVLRVARAKGAVSC